MAVDLRGLQFGSDPAYQNCAEFISAVVGVVGAIAKKWDTSAIGLVGDSVTALTWAEEGRFKSGNVMNAATVFSMICAMKGVNVVETVPISSGENWECDSLSRRRAGESWDELMGRIGVTYPHFEVLKEIEVL